jgi:hypothetical protein
MPVSRIEFSAGGLIDGWSSAEVEALDTQATETKLTRILREITDSPDAEIVITWESIADKVFGSWGYSTEKEEALEALRDYPWYDAQRWGEFKFLVTADGRKV